MIKLHLRNARVRPTFVQDSRTTVEYPDVRVALLCFRGYEVWGATFRGLRSFAIYLHPAESEEALRTLVAYTRALRNVVRLRRLSNKLRQERLLAVYWRRLHTRFDPALTALFQLEKDFLASINTMLIPDPTTVIPLYAKPRRIRMPNPNVWPSQPEEPPYVSGEEFSLELRPSSLLEGTAFEARSYFIYRSHIWSAGLDDPPAFWSSIVDSMLSTKLEASSKRRQPITEAVRLYVWRRDEGKYTRCGSRSKLEYDHIIAVANGGSNTARNIELLCEPCNRAKGAKVC